MRSNQALAFFTKGLFSTYASVNLLIGESSSSRFGFSPQPGRSTIAMWTEPKRPSPSPRWRRRMGDPQDLLRLQQLLLLSPLFPLLFRQVLLLPQLLFNVLLHLFLELFPSWRFCCFVHLVLELLPHMLSGFLVCACWLKSRQSVQPPRVIPNVAPLGAIIFWSC